MPEEQDDIITSPDDLEEEATEEEEELSESEDEEESSEEEEELSESEDEESSEEEDEEEPEDDKILMGDKEYTKEELEEIFSEGKKLREYKETHPGFDPILLHRDYTQKSMELAELKKKSGSQPVKDIPQPEKSDDLSDLNPNDIKLIERVLVAKGYVKKDQIDRMSAEQRKQNYEQVKNKEVNDFIKEYSIYHPSEDKDDTNWKKLLAEFQLYKLPEDPSKIGTLLRKAHKSITGSGGVDPKAAVKALAQKRANKVGQSAASGSAGGSKGKSKKNLPPAAEHLKGFSKEELQELFS